MTRTTQRLLLASVVLWPTLAVAQTPPPATIEYHHVDALGSIRVVTNASGAVVRTQNYHPFGEGVGVAPNGDPMGFTGKERDGETGLDYFGARYYAQRTGRFTTIDPIHTWKENLVDPQRWNRYAYVRNNPLRYVDPDGRAIETLWDLLNVGLSAKAVWNNPSSAANWGALVLDVGAAIVPALPAVGGTLRVIEGAEDVSRLARTALRSPTDRLTQHLSRSDLVGAAREVATGLPHGGKHLQEVQEAARGLRGRIDDINQGLANPNLSSFRRTELIDELRKASKYLDEAESALRGAYSPRK